MAQRRTPASAGTSTQSQKFIDAAREHGADGDQADFRRVLRKVATAPVAKPKKGSKPKKR